LTRLTMTSIFGDWNNPKDEIWMGVELFVPGE
jgi:hypothetical protein